MRVLIAFLTILLTPAVFAQTNVLFGNVTDFGLAPRSNITMTLSIVSPLNRTYNGQLVSNDPKTATTDTNGLFSFTNVIWGNYKLNPSDSSGTVWRPIVGTNTTGTVSFATIISNPSVLPPNPATNYYTQAQIDALLYGVTSGALTNAYATNAAGIFVTNRLAFISTNYASTSITNGLATTNYVLAQGFVTASVTNGLATTNYVNSATNGLVTASVTNGLATTNFVLAQGFVTSSVTNGLTTTNYVNTATNGVVNFVTNNYISTTQGTAISNSLLASISSTNTASLVITTNLIASKTNFDNITVTNYSLFKTNAYFAGDIYVTNHAYDVSTSQLDPLANEYVTASFVRSVLNNGAFLYGTTNTIAVGFSNILTSSTNTVSLQFGANAPAGYTKGFTNFVTGTYPNGPYFASIVSTSTYQAVTGPFVNDFYIQADGSGAGHALGIAPDIFVTYDLTNLIPICAGAEQSLTMAATTNLYTWIQAAAQYNSTNTTGFYIVRRVRVTSQNGNNLYINVKGGSGTATTLAFNTPVTVNANYSGTFSGNGSGLTNIPSTGITGLGTAAYSNSTAFASSGVTNLTAGQIATIAAAVTNNASPNFNFITSTNLLVTQANTNVLNFQFTNAANNGYLTWGTNKYYGNSFGGYTTYLTNDASGVPVAGEQWALWVINIPTYGNREFYYTTNSNPNNANWVAYNGIGSFGTGLTNSAFSTNNVISTSTGNLVSSGSFTGNGSGLTNIPATGIVGTAVTNNASPTFTGLSVGAQTALDVNGNGNFGGVGLTNGVLTGNGSGITNVSASLPSGTASLAIGSLSITNAIIVRTNSTIPTLITNASSTYITSATIDPSSNDSLILLNFTTAGNTLANGQYFTITLSQPATSTNSLIVLPMNSINTNQVANANGTLARFLPNSSSNSFSLWSSSTPPQASFSFTYAFLVFRR